MGAVDLRAGTCNRRYWRLPGLGPFGNCHQGMETEIVWYSLVIFSALGMPGLVQLDDQRGPYSEIGQCYHRGGELIKSIVSSGKFPLIIHTQALCLDTKNIKKSSGKTIDKSKPKPKIGSNI